MSIRHFFRTGDRVRRSDIRENSIPAFRAMRGTVVSVCNIGTLARIHWDGDSSPEEGYRNYFTIVQVEEGQ